MRMRVERDGHAMVTGEAGVNLGTLRLPGGMKNIHESSFV